MRKFFGAYPDSISYALLTRDVKIRIGDKDPGSATRACKDYLLGVHLLGPPNSAVRLESGCPAQ